MSCSGEHGIASSATGGNRGGAFNLCVRARRDLHGTCTTRPQAHDPSRWIDIALLTHTIGSDITMFHPNYMDHAFVELIQAKHNPRAMIDLMGWWWGRQRWRWWTKLAVVHDTTTMEHSHSMVTRLCPASLPELPKGLGACEIFGLEIREAEAHRRTSMLWGRQDSPPHAVRR
jgi:hypothetical protein